MQNKYRTSIYHSLNELIAKYHDCQMFLASQEQQNTYFFHCEEYAVSHLKSSPK